MLYCDVNQQWPQEQSTFLGCFIKKNWIKDEDYCLFYRNENIIKVRKYYKRHRIRYLKIFIDINKKVKAFDKI